MNPDGSFSVTLGQVDNVGATIYSADLTVNPLSGTNSINNFNQFQNAANSSALAGMITQLFNASALEGITFGADALAGQAEGQFAISITIPGTEYNVGMNNGVASIENVSVGALQGSLQAQLEALGIGIGTGDTLSFMSGIDGDLQFTLDNGNSYTINGSGEGITVTLRNDRHITGVSVSGSDIIGEGGIVLGGMNTNGRLGGRTIADIFAESDRGDSRSSQYRDIVNYVGDQVRKTMDAFGNKTITTIYFGSETDREKFEADAHSSTIVINAELIERVLGKAGADKTLDLEKDEKLNFEIMEQVALRSDGADEKFVAKATLSDFLKKVEESGIISKEDKEGITVTDENGNIKTGEEGLLYMFSNIMKRVILSTMRSEIMGKEEDENGNMIVRDEKGNAITPEEAFKSAITAALGMWGNVISGFGLEPGEPGVENSLYSKVKSFIEKSLNELSDKNDGLTWNNLMAAFENIMEFINNYLDIDAQRAEKKGMVNVYISDDEAAARLRKLYQLGIAGEDALKNMPEYYVIGNNVAQDVYDVFAGWLTKIKEDPRHDGKTIEIMRERAFDQNKHKGAIFAIGRIDESFDALQSMENLVIRKIPDQKSAAAAYGLMLIRFNMVRYNMIAALDAMSKNTKRINQYRDELKSIVDTALREQKKTAIKELEADNGLLRESVIDQSIFAGIKFCEKNRLTQILNAVERLKQNVGVYVTSA
jgi:Mn-dependent DtxR family transcriptional regulator